MVRNDNKHDISRVLQVIDNLEVGGAQRLLQTLAEHRDPGSRMPVLSLQRGDTPFRRALIDAGAQVEELGGIRLWSPLAPFKVWRAISKSGTRAVHIHLTYATILAAPLAKLAGKRVIVSLHNSDTVKLGDLRSRVLFALERLALRHFTDRVIFVGENVARANLAHIGRTPGVTIRNVIAPAPPAVRARRREMRMELGQSDEDVVVISTGRLSEQKDPALLLHAFLKARARAPHLALWFVGDGPLRADLEDIAARNGIAGRVRFLGDRGDVPGLLAAADIFALSSLWEGLPVGLLEAMAVGLPVVSTDVGDIAKVLSSDVAWLVPGGATDRFADGLAALGADPALRHTQAQKSLTAVRPFTDVEGWFQALCEQYALWD